jgi:hypothetical protein
LTDIRNYIKEYLDLSDPQGFFSEVFINQLEKGSQFTLDIFCIFETIKELSGEMPICRGRTKEAKPFRRPPLIGLWHKHFFQASFMPENLLLEFSKGENSKQAFHRAMKKSRFSLWRFSNS